jgi:hypothetical protein
MDSLSGAEFLPVQFFWGRKERKETQRTQGIFETSLRHFAPLCALCVLILQRTQNKLFTNVGYRNRAVVKSYFLLGAGNPRSALPVSCTIERLLNIRKRQQQIIWV